MSEPDAITLVREVMTEQGRRPPENDDGQTPEEITALVESVGRHARALVLLAQEVSRQGVKATTETRAEIMAELHDRYPDDRERSLYASVWLSFERLSPEHQHLARGLALFRRSAHTSVLGILLEIKPDAARKLCIALIDVGLGQDRGYGFVELDPALPSYLATLLETEERSALEVRWLAVMSDYVAFLHDQQGTEAQVTAILTRLELPNLLAFLEAQESVGTPEAVVQSATALEGLVSGLGRSSALERIVALRERAAAQLGDWSRAQYRALRADIERRLEAGDIRSAHAQAQALLERALAAGETAYPGADYDLAVVHLQLGRVLQMGAAAEAALEVLAEAERRFQILADAGSPEADAMPSVTHTDAADCLTALGKLDQAAALSRRLSLATMRPGVSVVSRSPRVSSQRFACYNDASTRP